MNVATAAATACAATFTFCVAALAAVVAAFIIYVAALAAVWIKVTKPLTVAAASAAT